MKEERLEASWGLESLVTNGIHRKCVGDGLGGILETVGPWAANPTQKRDNRGEGGWDPRRQIEITGQKEGEKRETMVLRHETWCQLATDSILIT